MSFTSLPDWFREIVYERNKKECVVCGATKGLELDHIVAKCCGGEHLNPDNIQIICRSCHIEKSKKDMGRMRVLCKEQEFLLRVIRI